MFGKIYEEIDGNLLKEFKSWDSKSKENYCFFLIGVGYLLTIQGVITRTSILIKTIYILSDDFSFLLTLLAYFLVYTFIFMFIRVFVVNFKLKKELKRNKKINENIKCFYCELYHHLNNEEQEMLKILYENKLGQEIIIYKENDQTFQVYNGLLNASKEDIIMLKYFLRMENYGYFLDKESYEEVIQSEFKVEKRSLKTLEEKLDFIEELQAKYDLKQRAQINNK